MSLLSAFVSVPSKCATEKPLYPLDCQRANRIYLGLRGQDKIDADSTEKGTSSSTQLVLQPI